MTAYLVLLAAVLTRLLPHAGWMNFTAMGGALLYFGARRNWREMLPALPVLIATDYFLTVFTYHYAFHWEAYVTTWGWYLAAMLLGRVLLSEKASFGRVTAAALLGPTSFFIVSNFAAWTSFGMYPHTPAGLGACYVAGIPFYRNDVVSTALVLGVLFGLPALARRMNPAATQTVAADK